MKPRELDTAYAEPMMRALARGIYVRNVVAQHAGAPHTTSFAYFTLSALTRNIRKSR